ncbi:Hypothetical predicted protein [Olea europaea subsp. europaea]|uniref:Uncharacterized protein n=1 Tax=Olea europaea subsp. europaea TaxID=158383 RepID=A0A8S0VDW2_OLEEU|nr:Hypothetical predicted protein [Olea europaea subsp. europaea]
MDRRKSVKRSAEYVGTAIESDSGGFPDDEDEAVASDDDTEVDSTIELDRPGEEKKKRWEEKAVAKSAVLVVSVSDSRSDKEW